MKRLLTPFILLVMAFTSITAFAAVAKDTRQRVRFETTAGTFVVALYDDTPIHRDNFLRLVRSGFYDGILFHRVIEGFMVQAGDPLSRSLPSAGSLSCREAGRRDQSRTSQQRVAVLHCLG